MTKSKDIRDVIIAHYQNGKNAPEISSTLANKVHRATVHRWIQRFSQSNSVNVRKSSGRRRTERTKRLINLGQMKT
jgi:transposase